MTQAAVHKRAGFTMADAITSALDQALDEDPRTLILGEDVGHLGGVFRITDGLQPKYGAARVIDTPLAEAGLVGTSIGLALNGLRPIVEIQFDGFVYPALNQICCHLARMPARLNDPALLPMVIRIPVGGRIRASELHSENPETYFAHTPNLRVVAASMPQTAKGLLMAAIRSDEPFIFLEPKRLYRRQRVEPEDEVATVDPGRARIVRDGDDALIITYGPMLDIALEAATALEDQRIEVAVLDLVSLAPIDETTVIEQASRTGRVVVAGEGIGRCSISSEVIAILASKAFGDLKTAPVMVTSPNRPCPPADDEDDYLPSVERLITAIQEVIR